MAEKTTTRFGVDITDLKKNFQEAVQTIKLANSEFNNAVAGMDDWGSSADGLSAKIKQLSTIESQEQKKLETLREEYRRVVEAQGENSTGAKTLATELNNQEATVKRVQKELQEYTNKLTDLTTETVDTRSNLEQLEDTIADQESQLKQIEKEYQNAVITFGETSEQAKLLQQSYNELSKSLEENRGSIVEVLTDEEKSKKAKEELKQKVDDLTGGTKNLSEGYTIVKDVIADFVKEGIQFAIDKFKELISVQDEATKSFQMQTGVTTESMSAYKDEMQSLYEQGYGETLNDIANAMAQVKQTTNETNPSKLVEMTKNAMLLGETYDFDVAESLRAVNMLTDQFGVTSQEAYSLIVQGCQNGLNKNGDLLDVINEYSVHYSQMGNTADEFFNSLLNGTKAGAFSVDKLGDGYKEFGIKTREVNDDVKSAYAKLGLITVDNSEKIDDFTKTIADQESKIDDLSYTLEKAKYEQSQFTEETDQFKKRDMERNIAKYESELSELQASLHSNKEALKDLQSTTSDTAMTYEDFLSKMNAGGNQSKEASKMVLDALNGLDDETEKNAIGVTLFGTMWEDSGEKAIQSMFDMNGEIDKTYNAMSQIEELRLTDVNSQLEVLGRTAETEIFIPLINVFLPYIKSGIAWVSQNMPVITNWIQNTLIPLVQEAISWIQTNLLPVVQAVFNWIIDNKDTIIATLVAIGTSFLVFNIVTMIQNAITILTALANVIQLVGVKQLILNAIMNANPIGILISLIVGLIAYFVYLYNTSEDFRMVLDWLWEKIKEFVDKVIDKVKEVWNFFEGYGEYLYDWIHVGIPNSLEELKNSIAVFIGNIIQKFVTMKDDIFNAGQNLVEGLWNGIWDKFGWITNKVQEFTSGILDSIKDFFGIHSPSKLFETDIGYNLVYGLANGITKKTNTAVKSMTDLAKATVSPFSEVQSNVGRVKSNLYSGLASKYGGVSNSTNNTTLNFYQTNTSPKSLSRLEVYRQTKNLLNFTKAVI